MKTFNSRAYSISDFYEWHKNGLLELSPDFQRRSVWSANAKSYLIDTIIRGRPIPKILISQRMQGGRTVRVIVDGQQRIRAILEFMDGDFNIAKAHNVELAGKTFDSLSEELQNDFRSYELGVDLLFDLDYEDILDIFSRINSYTVILNQQERFNAKYLGFFKQYCFRYGQKYVKYFIEGKILTRPQVARMGEAALATDLFVALVDKVQTNKSNESFYIEFEDEEGKLPEAADRFDNVMSYIGSIYPDGEIAQTNFRRIHLFYTLFTVIAHMIYKIGGLRPALGKSIDIRDIKKLRPILDDFSAKYDQIAADMDNKRHSARFKQFITHSRRGTTDTRARVERANFLCKYVIDRLD